MSYVYYVRLYLLMGYSLEDSQFHARLATDDLWERPEPKKQCNNADKEVPEKEDATIPEPEALDEQCRIALQPMLQSMVQNVSDEKVDTWGNWTAQGKSQQAPRSSRITTAESDSQETSYRITRRIRILLNSGYKCVSQACFQAESMIVSKKWLTKTELNKIKCKDRCCNPAGSSTSAPISEAATEHSEIRRLLNFADENPNNSEAATGHSKIPEAACLESRRSKKSEKGTCLHSRKTSSDSPTSSHTETLIPTMIPSDYTQVPSPASSNQCPSSTTTDIETLIPTEIESDDEQVPTVIASDDEQAPSDTPRKEDTPSDTPISVMHGFAFSSSSSHQCAQSLEAEEERVVELVAASIRRVTALEKQCAETSLLVRQLSHEQVQQAVRELSNSAETTLDSLFTVVDKTGSSTPVLKIVESDGFQRLLSRAQTCSTSVRTLQVDWLPREEKRARKFQYMKVMTKMKKHVKIENDQQTAAAVIASDDEPEIENIEPESKRPKIASENSQSSEAATEHFKIPEAACLETKRPRKSGKGSFSQTQKMMFPATNANPGA